MKTLLRFLWCTWLQQQLTSHFHYTAMFILQLSLMTTLLYKRSRVVKVHEINIPGGVKKLAERYWKADGKKEQKKKKVHFFLSCGGEKKSEDNKENIKIILFMKREEICMWNTGFTVIVFAFLYFQINQHLGGIWVWFSFFSPPTSTLKRQNKILIHWLITRNLKSYQNKCAKYRY